MIEDVQFADPSLELMAIRSGQQVMGEKLGFRLDDHLRFKAGNFNIWLGHSNTGKTHDLIYKACLWHIGLGKKFLVWSAENTPASLMRKVIQFCEGRTIFDMSQEELEAHIAYYSQAFYFMDTKKLISADELIEQIEWIYDNKFAFDGVIIDPYNALMVDGKDAAAKGGLQYHLEAGSKLRNMCKRTGAMTIIAMHPTTESARRRHPAGHEMAGHQAPPDEYDVSMGSIFVARADDFFVSHRYIHHEHKWNETLFEVKKVKETETGGRPTALSDPLVFTSLPYGVGFTFDGFDPIRYLKRKREGLPPEMGAAPQNELFDNTKPPIEL